MSIADGTATDVELAWLAGFIDGEGHFRQNRSRNLKAGRVSYQPRLVITNTDRELLERTVSIVGWGGIYDNPHRAPDGSPRKMRWQWMIGGFPRVRAVYAAIDPWLGTAKKRDAEAALTPRATEAIFR